MLWVSLLLAAALIALAVLWTRKRGVEGALARASQEAEQLRQRCSGLQEQLQVFSKYQGILDAEARASEIRSEAERSAEDILAAARRTAESLRSEARRAQEAAGEDARAVRTRAANDVAELRQKADALLANAATEARHIVEAANKRAEEIAGNAVVAMQNAERLEQTAKAMKNVIEGYGDQYVVPTHGLLDELADHFGFTEAGVRLKDARDRMRDMIKTGAAATCDYVEANRRSTAIEFVLDAFNGKVDSILTGVRNDNFGTLEQKVKDAFNIVNHNGRAFRDARITPEYLAVRLDELKWAVVAHELKLKEREEQRVLKERIREEEKAQREFERARREAEKEEELLRKALEKARREFEKAGDEQKAKYEEQLKELSGRLHLAEEKNQRALSMAQQTKTGHVYVISNVGSFGEDVYKVGLTRRLEPLDRIKELGDASVPFDFDVHALIRSDDAPALERELHKRFVRTQVNKVNPRKEFFRVALKDIRREVEQMGLQSQWTMTAESRDYKETLAIERAMQSKSFVESAWLKHQLEARDSSLDEEAGSKEAAG